MSQAGRINSLSWGDTFFLYLERQGQPLNVACTCEFEGTISLEACRKHVKSKLSLLPRYTQRAIFPPFNLGLPTWEPDPNFDIRSHVHRVALKGGTDTDLKAVAAKVVSSTLDRSRPLWDLTLVQGLKHKRTGLIIRIHHCLTDGVAGVAIMNALLDASPTPQKVPPKKQNAPEPQSTDSVALLFDRLLQSYQSFMQGALTAQSEVMTIARELLAGATNGHTDELVHLVPEIATPADRLPFNKVCRGPQQVAWGEMPMTDIKAIRESFGGTVNDVVLTVMTSTVRRYAELHGANLKGRHLRLIVPVNIRGNGNVGDLGNHITFLPINIPLDVRNPQTLLSRVSERMQFLRSVGVPDLVGLFGTLVSKVPLPLQAALVPLVTQLPLSLCNMICTNIPGPQQPLYLLGRKMLRTYPYVPIGGEMGVNVAILSYNGVAYVGFGGDVHAVPDIECFEDLLRVSFAELHDAAVGKPLSAKIPRAAVKVSPPPPPTKSAKVRKTPRPQPARSKVEAVPAPAVVTRRRRVVSNKTTVPLPPSPTTAAATAMAQSRD